MAWPKNPRCYVLVPWCCVVLFLTTTGHRAGADDLSLVRDLYEHTTSSIFCLDMDMEWLSTHPKHGDFPTEGRWVRDEARGLLDMTSPSIGYRSWNSSEGGLSWHAGGPLVAGTWKPEVIRKSRGELEILRRQYSVDMFLGVAAIPEGGCIGELLNSPSAALLSTSGESGDRTWHVALGTLQGPSGESLKYEASFSEKHGGLPTGFTVECVGTSAADQRYLAAGLGKCIWKVSAWSPVVCMRTSQTLLLPETMSWRDSKGAGWDLKATRISLNPSLSPDVFRGPAPVVGTQLIDETVEGSPRIEVHEQEAHLRALAEQAKVDAASRIASEASQPLAVAHAARSSRWWEVLCAVAALLLAVGVYCRVRRT